MSNKNEPAMAMQGLLSNSFAAKAVEGKINAEQTKDFITKISIDYADNLLEALND